MNDNNKVPTWEELLESMNNTEARPTDVAWNIYRYMNANLATLSSEEARALLAAYMKLPLVRPSLLHSCMLTVALKMVERYNDFKFVQFLKLWGYPSMLRSEDVRGQTGKDGKRYMALKERTERVWQSYLLRHAEERPSEEMACIWQMVAVKVFETETDGRKRRSVKLVGVDGRELLADSHLFPCKPWNIQGGLYDVLIRYPKDGNPRAQEIAVGKKALEDVFSVETGYVEHEDRQHGHYHVYDNGSRHFVAENPKLKVCQGDYVMFVPVVPEHDKFKSAIIVGKLSKGDGIRTFGQRKAKVTFVDEGKGYAVWELVAEAGQTDCVPIKETGTESPSFMKGYINRDLIEVAGLKMPAVGDMLKICVFLKRGKDGAKRPWVFSCLVV